LLSQEGAGLVTGVTGLTSHTIDPGGRESVPGVVAAWVLVSDVNGDNSEDGPLENTRPGSLGPELVN
jgi:hypothetical protein